MCISEISETIQLNKLLSEACEPWQHAEKNSAQARTDCLRASLAVLAWHKLFEQRGWLPSGAKLHAARARSAVSIDNATLAFASAR